MKKIRYFLPFIFTFLAFFPVQRAFAINPAAKQAILMDAETGVIMYEKNAYDIMYPASMTKIMTSHLVFDHLRDGRLSLDDTLTVSENAWRKGGSKMFVEVGKEVRVEDLLRGVIIQSGNDACIVLAEGLAGSEEAFAEEMNIKAAELGMESTHFKNATGWPDPEHVTSAYDLALLSRHLINTFPEFYPLYSEKSFTFNKIKQGNRNPLLYKNIGVDGIKTGHTEEAGYGLTSSAVQDGRRLILVLNGMKSQRARSSESEKMLRWGFREFQNITLFKAGDPVGIADVWLGATPHASLVLAEDLVVTIPRRNRRKVKARITYEAPIQAPVQKGEEVAFLRISIPGQEEIVKPLISGEDVGKLGGFRKVKAALGYLIWGGSTSTEGER